MKPKMFVSSSSEGKRIADAVHHNLQNAAEITVWDQGVIRPSSTVLESFDQYLDNSDFALFVFTPDDMVKVRGQEQSSARDNVILELGLFTGRLRKDRCFILVPEGEDLRIPTDLLGLTFLRYESNRSDNNPIAATSPACFQVREAMARLGLRAEASGSPTAGPEPQKDDNNLEVQQPALSGEATPSDQAEQFRWLNAFVEKDYDLAIELLQKRITQETDISERIDLESWIGRILYDKNPREGEIYLKKLLESHPEYSHPFEHLAYAHRVIQRFSEALIVVDSGLASVKDRSTLLRLKGTLLFEIGRQEEALTILRQGISEFPEQGDFYTQLADYLVDLREYNDAREVLEGGIQKLPKNETLLAKLARLLREHFEKEAALLRYNQLLILKPDNPEYLTLRANILLDLELYDLAMRDYKLANERAEEKQGWILANIGNLYKNRGFYREAIPHFQRALALMPEDEYAHERLAQALKLRAEEMNKLQEISQQAQRLSATSTHTSSQGNTTPLEPTS